MLPNNVSVRASACTQTDPHNLPVLVDNAANVHIGCFWVACRLATASELPSKVAYLTADIPCIKKHAVARARLGSAPVRAAIEHDTPFQERICRRCNQGVVDDECHWLFHCSALSHIRSKHAAVLRDRRSVDELMYAAYDDAEVAAFSDYIWDITQFVKGHRQGRSA